MRNKHLCVRIRNKGVAGTVKHGLRPPGIFLQTFQGGVSFVDPF